MKGGVFLFEGNEKVRDESRTHVGVRGESDTWTVICDEKQRNPKVPEPSLQVF